jgi:hypothetical protein
MRYKKSIVAIAIVSIAVIAAIVWALSVKNADPEDSERFNTYKEQLIIVKDAIRLYNRGTLNHERIDGHTTYFLDCETGEIKYHKETNKHVGSFKDLDTGETHYYDSYDTEVATLELTDVEMNAVRQLKTLYSNIGGIDCVYVYSTQVDFSYAEGTRVFSFVLKNKVPEYYHRGQKTEYYVTKLDKYWYFAELH